MKLIDEIVESLTSENPNLDFALTKTKVLLYKIGEQQLVPWVNAELNGYTNIEEIPDYRIISTRVRVTATDGYTTRWNNHHAPISHLDERIKAQLDRTRMPQGIAALQHLISADPESDTLSKPLAPEICPLLSLGLAPGIHVESAYVEIGKSQLISILAQIKTRLLDFILELESKLPADTQDSNVKERSKSIATEALFKDAIFGDNTTILVGHDNTQSVSNQITKNDFDKLSSYLRDANVSTDDIEELKKAIAGDEGKVDHPKRTYGPNVKSWMKMMLGKAIDTAWQVDIGVASSLLAAGLNSYYGWF